MQTVYDWVDTLEAHSALRYSLASSYPRRVLSVQSDGSATLESLGLAPQAALFVQGDDGE